MMKLSRKRPVVKSSGSEASGSEDLEKKQSKISKFFSKSILPSTKLDKPPENLDPGGNDLAVETENDPPNDSDVIEQTPERGLSGRLSKLKKFSKISLASARSSSRIVTSTPTDPPISKRPKLGSPKIEMMPKISPVLASKKTNLKLQEESSFERPTNLRTLSSSPEGKPQPSSLRSPEKHQLPVCVEPAQSVISEPPLSYKYGRHKVVSVNTTSKMGREIELELKNCHDKTDCKIILRGSWVHTSVNEGDIINLLNVKETSINDQEPIVIDDMSGLLIVHPDLLLSGTSIVLSLFCMRKAVLNERFKGIEGSNRTMFVGTFVHILMQECLRLMCRSKEDVQIQFENVIKMPSIRQEMLMLGMNESDLKQEVEPFLPHIVFFIERYVVGREVPVPSAAYSNLGGGGVQRSYAGRPPPSPTVWPGRIEEIKDIEESIWSPRLGIKGKVDMTVQVKLKVKDKQGRISKTIPLELKTGRPSGSVEHRGQVILYSMMMAERRPDPESGLLLYLRTSSLQEVQAGIHDIRGLVQLRNQLASHLKLQGNYPDPINLKRSCDQCGQLGVCALFQKISNTVPDSPHAMAELVPLSVNHLSEEDLRFFEKWNTLIALETEESMKTHRQKNLWCQTPKIRESNKRALANLDLIPSKFRPDEVQFVQTFTRNETLPLNVFRVDDPVLVSTDKALGLCQGIVKFVSTEKISLSLDKDLSQWKHTKFNVDILEYQQTFGGINLTNLARIMDNTERASTLRDIIVSGTKRATFLPGLPKDVAYIGKQILRPLNRVQQRAIFKTLMANEFVLIKGYPGSGKTTAIVALIRLIVALGKTVLLTSYTHAAVDNVLVKLLKEDDEKKVSILRVGQPSRIHNDILPFCAEVLGKSFGGDVGQLKQLFESKQVVASTCLGINHPAIAGRTFDYCIFDEAGQSMMLSTVGPLFYCRKFVLVGDPEQLPPVVQSAEARKKGLEASLFAHLESPENVIPLTLQYRMNRDIQALANFMTYKGELECGSEEVSERSLHKRDDLKISSDHVWIDSILDCNVEKSVIFVDTSGVPHEERQDDLGICNDLEGKIIFQVLHHMNKYSSKNDVYKPPTIGVIAPYRSQVANLSKIIDRMDPNGIERPIVSTVDQFQGRDQDVIIYSCTRTKSKSDNEKTTDIMSDSRRLNVAITRAKMKLIIIGHSEALITYPPFKVLIGYLKEKDKILKIDNRKVAL